MTEKRTTHIIYKTEKTKSRWSIIIYPKFELTFLSVKRRKKYCNIVNNNKSDETNIFVLLKNVFIIVFSGCSEHCMDTFWLLNLQDSPGLVSTGLFMSKQTPPQRQQSPPLITLYRNLLVSYSDTSNIESLEFPFHTLRGRGGWQRGGQSGGHTGAAEEREKSKERWD